MKLNSFTRFTLVSAVMTAAALSGNAFAQTDVPDHPRVNEVNDRLENQQDRIQTGVADGQINAKQAARDEQHDANISQRESADEAKDGGHLTQTEQHNLNQSLNKNSHAIARQDNDVPNHPRVNEVNNRLENQQGRIQAGVADGQINAKQASRDETHDANIAQRESADQAKDGGHLTKVDQRNLNRSLNRNSNAIHRQRVR